MRKKATSTILIFFAIFINFSCHKKNEIDEFKDNLLTIVKDNSIYSENINWPLLVSEIDSITENSQEKDVRTLTVMHVINHLRAVGDYHTLYMTKDQSNEFFDQKQDIVNPEGKLLSNHIAYVKVPGFASGDISKQNQFAVKIQNLIKSLDSKQIKGWIVDLRGNWGGGMYSMIVGLGPLLEEGILGYFILQNGKKESWSYKNGKSNGISVVNPYIVQNKNFKIAILINSQTASSGEMTAISFMRKQNVKLIGSPSAGYTTGNRPFMLKDGSYIHLASAHVADRNMNKIYGSIIPDILIYDYSFFCDDYIEVALKWINEME